ncbi:MAG: type II secretion system inner membrane protein GspF [Deltaproteobacteria bacterium]|nr:type II secretion system inner membrane protein GspF [Deltaproteobacteria bacterium]
MPIFEYKGVNAKGKNIAGIIDAESPRVARTRLKREGIFLTNLIEGKEGTAGGRKAFDLKKSFQRVSALDLAIITRQFATLVRAGIPLVDCLTALVDQTDNEKLKRVLSRVKDRVNEGSSMADALKNFPKVFNSLYINMIAAGEQSGTLEIVLQRLADFTEAQVKLRSKVRSAMLYPIILSVIIVIILAVLFTFVIPKITRVFEGAKIVLPLITRILIAMADLFSSYWYMVLLLVIILTVVLRGILKTEAGHAFKDRKVLELPVFGPLIRMVAISRFSRTLATLLKSGVPLLVSMDIVRNVVANQTLADAIDDARDAVREGESIATTLKKSGQFPPIVFHMISTGEKTGQLEEMLSNVADTYDEQVDAKLSALTTALEPLMIVIMGGIVAFIVFSVLLPIMQMMEQVK